MKARYVFGMEADAAAGRRGLHERVGVDELIGTIKDARVVEARELTSSKGRLRLGKCLLEGTEAVGWALDSGITIERAFVQAARLGDAFVSTLRTSHVPVHVVSDGILKKITDTAYLVPVVGVARLVSDVPANIPAGDVVVVLDRVQDQGNVGTIVRTARAFGVRDLVSTCPDLDLFYKKTIDASRGTVFDARLRRYASGVAAIGALKAQGYQVVATSSYGRSVQALALLQDKPVALVVGNETTGVADDILAAADAVVQIPLSGPVESLNVGVAAGISVYELKMKVVLAMLVRHIRATLGREVSVAGTLIRQAFDAALRAVSDLTSAQVILLMQLACDEAMTPEQISRDTATSGVELEDLLRPLHVRGYIAVSSLADGSIRVTGEGERALAALWPVVERSEERILAGFADDERAQLRAYLGRLQANCALVTAPKGEEVTS